MKRSASRIAAVCATLALPATAAAQDQVWLQDRRYAEGIGIRTGSFEIHPGGAVEIGYDSNYFHRAPEEDPVGSMRLRASGHLFFSTLGPQRRGAAPSASLPEFDFRGGLSLTYHEFFPVSGPDAGQEIMKDQRNVSGALDLTFNILPGRPWSGTIFGDIARNITPSPQGITSDSFNRMNARAGAELAWQPGGGLLDWRLGYRFSGTIFESDRFSQLTNVENTLQTRGRWRFLPRTALMYDARFGFLNYTAGDKAAHPLRVQMGLNGLITQSFGILALAGWGSSFYTAPSEDHNFDSLIAQLEVKWYITPAPSIDPAAAPMSISAVTLGFVRDFQDSYIGTYFERDRGYASLAYLFAGKFLLVAEAGAGAVVYPGVPEFERPDGWTDVRVDASLFGEYRFKDYFGLNATIRYGGNLSSQSLPVLLSPGSSESALDYLGYHQFEAYLGARFFM